MVQLVESLSSRLAPLPRQVGRYELLEPLGSGGMGTVYRARQIQLEKSVAIKLLDPRLASRSRGVTRFLREARAAAQIRHPNVIEVFDVGIDEGVVFLAMEWLEGMDVAALLRERGRLELHELIELLAPVLAGVRAAHEAGVVHRDLKPSNLFLARRGRGRVEPVVLDFGVSRLVEDELRDLTPVTEPEAMIGTAAYVAPEQARDGRLADDRSDQYSLAVIAYECATGERPFHGKNLLDLLQAITTAEIRPPSQLNPALPPEFDAVLLRALAREPEQRFPDLRAFACALMAFAAPRTWILWGQELTGQELETADRFNILATAPTSQPRPGVALASPKARRTRRERAVVLAGFGAGVLLASSAFGLWSSAFKSGKDHVPLACAGESSAAQGAHESRLPAPPSPSLASSALKNEQPAPVQTADSASSNVPAKVPNRAISSGARRAGRNSSAAEPSVRLPSRAVELGVNDAPILE